MKKTIIFISFILIIFPFFSCERRENPQSSNSRTIHDMEYSEVIEIIPVNDEADFQVTLNANGDGVVIVRYIGRSNVVHIPAIIQGIPVIEIGEAAFSRDSSTLSRIDVDINYIIIPSGITKIGRYAFANQSIRSLVLPDTIKILEAGAFSNCKELTSVSLPAAPDNIGDSSGGTGVFSGCSALEKIIIPEGYLYIGYAMFSGTGLKEIIIPSSIEDIGHYAFSYSSLSSIIFNGNNLKNIWNEAFAGCDFTTFEIPEGVERIGEKAFEYNRDLITLTFPSTIRQIGMSAFKDCIALTTVNIPDSARSINFLQGYNLSRDLRDASPAFYGVDNLSLASQAALRRVGYTQVFGTPALILE